MAQMVILSNAGDADSKLWWYYTELGGEPAKTRRPRCAGSNTPHRRRPVHDRHHQPVNWEYANRHSASRGVDLDALAAASREMDVQTFRKEHLTCGWTGR